MKIPYGYALIDEEIIVNEEKADVVRSIFGYYLTGASLGKIVDMLYATGILSPSGNPKWGRAAVDKLLANAKYIPIVGVETYYFNSDGELVCFDASLSEICWRGNIYGGSV